MKALARRCRICGCTDDAACPGQCRWVPDPLKRGPLCSACHPVSGGPFGPGFNVLAGVHRIPAIVKAVYFDDVSLVAVYDVVGDDDGVTYYGLAASDVVRRDTNHPDHPDHGWGPHRRTLTDVSCPGCGEGSCTCLSTYVEVCEFDDHPWPCDTVLAFRAGRASALGPLGDQVIETRTIGPAQPRTGTVIAVDGERLQIRTPQRTFTWVRAEDVAVQAPAAEAVTR